MTLAVLSVTPAVFGNEGLVGGAERYVHSITSALNAALPDRFSLGILGLTDKKPQEYQDGSTRVILVGTDNHSSDRMDWYGRGIWSALREFDLIHVHQPFTRCGEVALLAAATLNKPIIVTDLGGGLPPVNFRDHAISFADRIVAISRFSAGLLKHDASTPVDVIIGPVSQIFISAPSSTKSRNSALYVGRILPHKGIDRFIKAAPPDLKVRIAGAIHDAEYARHLHTLAAGKQVDFINNPTDDELLELYDNAAIHVAPSVTKDYRGGYHPNAELMGITTIESLARGTPVAVSDTCSLPELIGDGEVGECFSNERELESILQRVKNGEWIDQYPPERCIEFARSNYAPEVVGRRLAEAYEATVRSGGGH